MRAHVKRYSLLVGEAHYIRDNPGKFYMNISSGIKAANYLIIVEQNIDSTSEDPSAYTSVTNWSEVTRFTDLATENVTLQLISLHLIVQNGESDGKSFQIKNLMICHQLCIYTPIKNQIEILMTHTLQLFMIGPTVNLLMEVHIFITKMEHSILISLIMT